MFSVKSPLETRDQDKGKNQPEIIFPGEKEVLWDCKESCHMKSTGETVKQNFTVLEFVVGFALCPSGL